MIIELLTIGIIIMGCLLGSLFISISLKKMEMEKRRRKLNHWEATHIEKEEVNK